VHEPAAVDVLECLGDLHEDLLGAAEALLRRDLLPALDDLLELAPRRYSIV
jgi:hypothetical protein